VGELYAPATGTVTDVNDAVVSNPELVNDDPFGAGWLIKISITDAPALLDAAAYTALTGE
jgi:glycine cleavage system H protein